MNRQANPAGGDQSGGLALVAAAARLLAERKSAVPEAFVGKLFALAAPEDLRHCGAVELANIAEQSWSFLAERRPGAPKIRFEPLAGARGVAVLEIVNDDMPFLVDSVVGELNSRGLEIRSFVHPVFLVRRDAAGRLVEFEAPHAPDARRESFIHFHVDEADDPAQRAAVVHALNDILAEVRVSVQDWQPMLTRGRDVIAELETKPPPLASEEIVEAVAFLHWMAEENFTLLGARDYVFTNDEILAPVFETGLGLLRDSGVRLLQHWNKPVTITSAVRAFLQEQTLLIITKSSARSRVHRHVPIDYVGVKRFDRAGKLIGEHRFCGLFTSTAYTQPARGIPYLRRKIDRIIGRAGFDPASHSGKALVNVLETYPRDELFQIDEESLYHFALEILHLDERPRVRVLPRRDRFGRYVSVLVYVPRDRYSGQIRAAIGRYLTAAFHGRLSAYYPFFPESPLVRVQYIVARSEGALDNPDRGALDRGVEAIVRSWTDALRDALATDSDLSRARALFSRYRDAFPIDYQEVYSAANAMADIRGLETLSAQRPLGVVFYRPQGAAPTRVGLKVFSQNRPISLSERVPVLENMGFRVVDERTYHIRPAEAAEVWFHDMELESASGQSIDLSASESRLQACFLVVMAQAAENDGYNALVLAAGLGWREVALIRTISRFLRQLKVAYSQDYMWTTLRKHAAVAAQIFDLFRTRFDPRSALPAQQRAAGEKEILSAIETALQLVDSLDEDRIIRHFVSAVIAALRTNFYQLDRDGRAKDVIAIKFASRTLDAVPPPRPLYEVFVYSARLEAVHLRFGKVARGGIRWSDRPQDFRTEILSLAKAQQVKNVVIVPQGAKGGFVPRTLQQASGEAAQAEGIACYKSFVSSLLSLTDNRVKGEIVPPERTIRRDGDDPYLVVAADKGTASFSDIANEIALSGNFWLGDAFASGGSAGYDHKKMGITAKGAWEAVKRHFREMNIDIQTAPFTVAGIGDMSGDVFGNGMLLSKTIKLVAAFDHRDIFIDPDPDPAVSFKERMRLFHLPRSSWNDYGRSKLSKGGGVYSRSEKYITLSAEAQKLLGVGPAITPAGIMAAIVKAPVDLLWFGGIGTYVRASGETDAQVNDKANDAIRATAKDLRAKVIGEGANLGVTQRGRIEFALAGGRVNTDAIDNSAGVNTSDAEVNIKIALGAAAAAGKLDTPARNELLAAMTDEVAASVLRNNYLQTLAISLAEMDGLADLGFQQRLMQTLESQGHLDRALENLPSDAAILERQAAAKPLTRPELAVLLAYAKIDLNRSLIGSAVPDDPHLGRALRAYFPPLMRERFADEIAQHPLRREIIATSLANDIINSGGPTFIVRLMEETGNTPEDIAYAFAAVMAVYGLGTIYAGIDSLDGKTGGRQQLLLYRRVQDLLRKQTAWFLRHGLSEESLEPEIERYRDGVEYLAINLAAALPKEPLARIENEQEHVEAEGVPAVLAQRLAAMGPLLQALDAVRVANTMKAPIADAARAIFAIRDAFHLDELAAASEALAAGDYFDRLAVNSSLASAASAQRALARNVIEHPSAKGDFEAWRKRNEAASGRVAAALAGMLEGRGLTLAKLTVGVAQLRDLGAA
ncbi:MAG: NAD-glutamate dehydrogenase [Xanthobacteraceae bacterium]